MAYNEKIANRVRKALAGRQDVEEKKMFGGLAFMVSGKMCLTIGKDRIMCRIDPLLHEEAIKKDNAVTVVMRGRPYRGYIRVSEAGIESKKDFDYWVGLALSYNKQIRAVGK